MLLLHRVLCSEDNVCPRRASSPGEVMIRAAREPELTSIDKTHAGGWDARSKHRKSFLSSLLCERLSLTMSFGTRRLFWVSECA